MKEDVVFSVLFCSICLLGLFQESNASQEKPLMATQSPSNFSVAPGAFVDMSSTQVLNRQLAVESKSLRLWLSETGSFGELVGLSDKREIYPLFFKDDPIVFEGTATPVQQSLEDKNGTFPEDRVCDIVYQFLRKNHNLPPIYRRYGIERRDGLVQKLILSIQKANSADKAKGADKKGEEQSKGPGDRKRN